MVVRYTPDLVLSYTNMSLQCFTQYRDLLECTSISNCLNELAPKSQGFLTTKHIKGKYNEKVTRL